MLIGVDLDNTIIKYDELFRQLVAEQGLLNDDGVMSKQEVRDSLRKQPGGEQAWTDIQALVYGPRIHEALAFAGALAFFECCHRHNVETCIVSHKTQFAASDKGKTTNLRTVAMAWLEENSFFSTLTPLGVNDVYFASTRQAKVSKIAELGCDMFIDDLLEVFIEPGFPEQAEQFLFLPNALSAPVGFSGTLCTAWDEMTARLEARYGA